MEAIRINNLKKIYDNNTVALDDFNMSVEVSDFFALLGPNGAGKSTVIGIITGLINKTAGTVSAFGHDLDKQPSLLKQHIGVVPQEFNFSIFEKVINIVIQQGGYYGIPFSEARKRAEKYLKLLDLWKQKDNISKTLSGGMKRRLMIARALIHEPKVLILDEPTAGVDIEIRHSMWTFLKQLNKNGTTIILTTHYLEEVEKLCRNVAIIDRGRVIAHSSVKDIVKKVTTQSYLIEIASPLDSLPAHNPFHLKQISPESLELELTNGSHLNSIFQWLETHSIRVQNIREKTNRIESLLLQLLKKR